MDADTSMKILVIVLATTLAIFLILSIVLVIKLIQIATGLKRIATKAEEVVDKAEAVTELFQKTAGPIAIGHFLSNITDMIGRKNKGGK